MPLRSGPLLALALLLAGCGPAAPGAGGGTTAEAAQELPLVFFLGDELTGADDLPPELAYPAVLGRTLEREGRPIRVVNLAGRDSTSREVLERLDLVCERRPDVVVLQVGSSDAEHSIGLDETRANLDAIARRLHGAGAVVVLTGMHLTDARLERGYPVQFERMQAELAAELGLELVPYFLEGVGGVLELQRFDLAHPNAEGQRRLAENLRRTLVRVLDRLDEEE